MRLKTLVLSLKSRKDLLESIAVPMLIECLNSDDSRTRSLASEALLEIGDEYAMAYAMAVLTVYAELLWEARDALQRIGASPMSLREAVSVLAERNQWVVLVRAMTSVGVREAVDSLGDSAVPVLMSALLSKDWRVRKAACESLGRLRNADAVPILIDSLHDENPWVVESACRALGAIGGADAAQALTDALIEGDWWLREAASEALSAMTGK